MRIVVPIIAILACFPSPADAASRNFGVSGFEKIRVDGPFKVRLTTGVPPFATATGAQAAINTVTIDMQGRTLVVRSNRTSWGGFPGDPNGAVESNIGTHELNAAFLNGSGSIAIDKVRGLSFDLSVQGAGSASIGSVAVDQLKLSIAGTATANLAGTAPKLTAMVRGISTLDASALSSKDATIGAQGPANVKAMVTGTAKVDAMGAAAVELHGRPACTVKAAGSATVTGCR